MSLETLIAGVLTVAGFTLVKARAYRILKVVNDVLFYVTLPGLIFFTIVDLEGVDEFLAMVFISLIHMCVMFVFTYLTSRAFLKDALMRLTIATSLTINNAIFLAMPLSTLIYGYATPVLPYSIAFNIYLTPYLVFLTFKVPGNSNNLSKALKPLPHIIAFIASLSLKLTAYDLNLGLDQVLKLLSYMNYAGFLIIGGQLAKLKIDYLRSFMRSVLIASVIKYVVSPTAAVLLYMSLTLLKHISGIYFNGFILQSLMPPAITTVVIAETYKLDVEFTTLLLTVLTPISIIVSIAVGYLIV